MGDTRPPPPILSAKWPASRHALSARAVKTLAWGSSYPPYHTRQVVQRAPHPDPLPVGRGGVGRREGQIGDHLVKHDANGRSTWQVVPPVVALHDPTCSGEKRNSRVWGEAGAEDSCGFGENAVWRQVWPPCRKKSIIVAESWRDYGGGKSGGLGRQLAIRV